MGDDRDRPFMQAALELARVAATKGQTPFGAVVIDPAGTIIGEGHNQVRADHDPAAHGEIVAMRDAWGRLGARDALAACTLYTSCEPCLMCSFAITQFRMRRVVFAARASDVPTYQSLLDADFTQAAEWVNRHSDWSPIEVRGEFMREEALEALQAFAWT